MTGGRCDAGWTLGGAAALVAVWAAGVTTALVLAPPDPADRAAALAVAGGCLSGAVGGWLLARLGDRLAVSPSSGRHGLAVAAGLGGIALRLTPPLVMLAWLRGGGPGGPQAGVERMLLGLYLALLATDILLTIIGRSGSAAGRGKSGAN